MLILEKEIINLNNKLFLDDITSSFNKNGFIINFLTLMHFSRKMELLF